MTLYLVVTPLRGLFSPRTPVFPGGKLENASSKLNKITIMFHNKGLIIKRWIIQGHRGHIPGIAQGAGLHPQISEKIKRPPNARRANRESKTGSQKQDLIL